MTMFDKGTQKELKDQYKTLLADVWGNDNHMIDYCAKKAEVIYKTEEGFFLNIEKQDIEKDFCFGYSCSRYDTEDFDRANKMAHHARNSVDYFRVENLKPLNEKIEFYSNPDNMLFFRNHYQSQKNNILKTVHCLQRWERLEDVYNNADFIPVSENDRKIIVDAYKKELELFTKRLETYIKRYGLSKVRSWSYWRDE